MKKLIATMLGGCKKDLNSKNGCSGNPDAGTIMHDGELREYVLYVPSSYSEGRMIPLVVNFHGYGGMAADFMETADLRQLAESDTFMLVYPQGSCLDGVPHWNAGLDVPENKSDADDLGFIEVLLNDLLANYNIDSERIYVCGYSNGAMMAYALACYRSELIAAVGSVSGTMLTETVNSCSASHPTAIVHIHGTSDEILPYAGGDGHPAVAEIMNHWIAYNNADPTPEITTSSDGGNLVEQHLYTNGDGSVDVIHYKVVDGGHVWFNLDFQGSSTERVIWDLISRYDVNGLR